MKDKITPHASPIAGPPRLTPGQVWRQIGVILLVVVIWAGLLVVYLNVTGGRKMPTVRPSQPTEAAAPTLVPTEAAAPTEVPTTAQPVTATRSGPTATERLALATPTPPAQVGASVSFARDVLPLLRVRCERCHGSSRAEEGFVISGYSQIMAGSNNGPVITPGSSATSLLVELIVSGEMPRRSPRLPDSEIEIIRAWIDEGAPDN